MRSRVIVSVSMTVGQKSELESASRESGMTVSGYIKGKLFPGAGRVVRDEVVDEPAGVEPACSNVFEQPLAPAPSKVDVIPDFGPPEAPSAVLPVPPVWPAAQPVRWTCPDCGQRHIGSASCSCGGGGS